MEIKMKMMQRIKSILSIILLMAILAALGVAGTHYAIRLDLWLSIPIVVALWAGLGLLGLAVYERGSEDWRSVDGGPIHVRKERGK